MGLKEKQALAGLDFSYSIKRIKDNAGIDVSIEADAASFSNDMEAIMYADSRGAMHAGNAISRIADQEIGKEALKGITKILLVNHEPGKGKSIQIKDGVMQITSSFDSKESKDFFSESELRQQIENSL